ncbi:unnamed protein product [Tuber aestivum]|uniref:NB-ARC domain-containing protein n=1 Tax=Tuber aestivum TaxID=59557 RepID=A0A292PK41_9PEZI|nr:unnamed protein product [Tuber aestivum]
MDQRIPFDIGGTSCGNSGDHDSFGSRNDNRANTGNPYIPNLGQTQQGRMPGAQRGGETSRPYRIIPYCRNTKFTGRKDLIDLLRRISESKGGNRIALNGLGGTGKTQIALEYVYQRAGEGDCGIFWVQGSGVAKFSEGFRTIAQHVRIPPASAETDEEGLLLNIKRWLEGPDSGDWIQVIDNADNEEDFIDNRGPISKFVPQGPRGTLIFTTRSPLIASGQDCERIDVGKMQEDEAQALFLRLVGNRNSWGDEEKEAITMILNFIDHIPLAIVGATAFMMESQTRPSTYWTVLQGSDEQANRLLSRPFYDIHREADMTESSLTTYFATFDRITQKTPRAGDLQRLISLFDRRNIPEELLSHSGLEGMNDPFEFRQASGILLEFSLVTIVKCEGKTFYELRRLVQLSLQEYVPNGLLCRWRSTALGVVSRLFPHDENERGCVGSAYIPHVIAVTKDGKGPTAESLRVRVGHHCLDMGFYHEAEILLRRSITLREESKKYEWDEEGQKRVILLGAVSVYQGKAQVAEKMFRNLLEDNEESLGPNNPSVLQAIDYLAMALRYQGKYHESEAMNRRALEGRKEILGPDHPDTLTSVDNLAIMLQHQGRYYESEKMNRYALQGREKTFGPDHPRTQTSANSLAMVLQYQGKYHESEQMNRRALECSEKILGPDHPDTLSSANNVAILLRYQGKHGESEAMKQRVLEGYEKIFGPDRPEQLTTINNLAIVLQYQGEYNGSETMNRRALEGREKFLGPDHPDTLISVTNLAIVLGFQGKYSESGTMYRLALERQMKIHGPDHPDTLSSANNLATLLRFQEECDDAETIWLRARQTLPGNQDNTWPPFAGPVRCFRRTLDSTRPLDQPSDSFHRRQYFGCSGGGDWLVFSPGSGYSRITRGGMADCAGLGK